MSALAPGDRKNRAAQNFATLRAWREAGDRLGVQQALTEIWAERQWESLGYESFRDACRAIVGDLPQLERDARRETVAELTQQGMSTRAIADTLGVSDTTVIRDQRISGASCEAPEVRGTDGKTYPRSPIAPEAARAAEEVEASPHILDEDGAAVGEFLDGDPDLRDANIRKRFSQWLHAIHQHHLFDAGEVARIAPDRLEDLERTRAKFDAWCDAFAATAAPRPALRVVSKGNG